MDQFIPAIMILLILAGGIILLVDRGQRKSIEADMLRMRASNMYEEIYSLLFSFAGTPVDTVTIWDEQVLFKLLDEHHSLHVFDFQSHHMRSLNDRRILILSQLLALDIPELSSVRCYVYSRKKIRKPNGKWSLRCEYVAREAYKTQIIREMMDPAYTEGIVG